jgi:D-amino-acid dehydrogenase
VPYQVLDRAGYLQYEPALAGVQDKFVGALRLPGDETGDCLLFTQRLARMAEGLGARFRFGTTITGLATDGRRVTGVDTDQGRLVADEVVLALGSHSPRWLRPLGIDIPVYPVKGFSITVPITDAAAAPESTLMDETHKVAVTRLGERIRVGGMAQLSGYDLALVEARRRTLEFVLTDLFPRAGDLSRATFWTGLRPMTPDGTPILGRTRLANLTLATGHGTLGWTMAAGTGRAIADLLSGRRPEIDFAGLTVDRYAARDGFAG